MLAARIGLACLAMSALGISAAPLALVAPGMVLIASASALRLRRAHRQQAGALRLADDGAWLVLREGAGPPRLFEQARVQVRAGLAWIEAVGPDGRRRRWTWWPDTVDAAGLRRLRLASRGPGAHSAPAIATMPG